jgi:hypothetical protein
VTIPLHSGKEIGPHLFFKILHQLARTIQCAPTAQITGG